MVSVIHLVFCCLLPVLSLCSADIQLTIHWTHGNGTQQELTPARFARLAEEERNGSHIDKRNAVKDWKYLWYMGTVYYDIDARTVDFRLLQILGPAFQFFEKYTCIRWKRRIPGDGHNDYVVFTMPYGNVRICNSAVGKQTGKQYINLDTECVKSLAKVLHQMTHAIGFYHVHTRPDRDQYISVFPNNASPKNRKFFDMESPDDADTMGFPYEYKSLMHFDSLQYAAGSDPTIKAKVPNVKLGNNQALTVQDVLMINKLYSECKMSCRFANGHCEHSCIDDKPGQVTCICLQGYQLKKDGRTCYDVDECAENNGGCDHTCVKHGSWYKCDCRQGYRLHNNGYSCRENNLCETGKLKCEQDCNFNKCGCRQGYHLKTDQTTCEDINECHVGNGGCQGICQNTVGSFHCSCPNGKYLSNDRKSCTDIKCTSAPSVANAEVVCTNNKMVDGTVCQYNCQKGYKLTGSDEMVCKAGKWEGRPPLCKETNRCQIDNGGCEQLCWANSWDNIKCSCKVGFALHKNGVNCTDIEPPTIVSCPKDIYTLTVPKKSFAFVTWELPRFYDNVGAKIISGPVMQDQIGGIYDIGSHTVNYIIKDEAGLEGRCVFKIKVNDVEAPDLFNCPSAKTYDVTDQHQNIRADWEDPSFWDNSEKVTVTTDLPSTRLMQPRTQEVHYIATDPSGNSKVCTIIITVVVKEVNCKSFPYQPFGGSVQCDEFAFGTQCTPSCDSGYDLMNEGFAPVYSCYKNKWRPDPKPITCPDLRQPLRGPTLQYELFYEHKCSQFRTISVSQLEQTATRLAQRYTKTLCPTLGDACKLTIKAIVDCSKTESVRLVVTTTEPVNVPATRRYKQRLRDNIKMNQTKIFFYIPIDTVVSAPVAKDEGLKAVPKIDFACNPGDKADLVALKCYSDPTGK